MNKVATSHNFRSTIKVIAVVIMLFVLVNLA
jgi:hypothetical protein